MFTVGNGLETTGTLLTTKKSESTGTSCGIQLIDDKKYYRMPQSKQVSESTDGRIRERREKTGWHWNARLVELAEDEHNMNYIEFYYRDTTIIIYYLLLLLYSTDNHQSRVRTYVHGRHTGTGV